MRGAGDGGFFLLMAIVVIAFMVPLAFVGCNEKDSSVRCKNNVVYSTSNTFTLDDAREFCSHQGGVLKFEEGD